MRRIYICLSAIFVLTTITLSAQIKHSGYRAMLRNLLSHSVPERSVTDAVKDSTAIFLDAREPREYEVSHLNGAKYVGYDHFSMDSLQQIPKNRRIVVYCSVGYRSEKIAEKLIAAGYTDVANLYGGIFEWVNQGQTVVNKKGTTEEVHAYDRTWGVWLRRGKKVYR
jgi:rhodanese-related sulfurtransferase